jgi:diphthamide biosynthesis protein 7
MIAAASIDTVQPACSVEFLGTTALIGTYELREATRTKHGGVARVQTADVDLAEVRLDGVRELPSAVLDLKCAADARSVACALSDGAVALLDAELADVASLRCAQVDASALALALEWSDRRCAASQPQLCVSYSDGRVAVFDVAVEQCVSVWKPHSLEAWTVAFDCWQPAVVMSGADDGRFRVYDTRASTQAPVASRQYEMGVTAVQSHTAREHYVAVGSYDESIAVFDLRALREPVARHDSGGGVWRLKWRPDGADVLLAACMHAGWATLELDDGARELRAFAQWFAPHASMAYGADWRTDAALIGCCSFYDHRFSLYRHDPRPSRAPADQAPVPPSAPAASAAPPAP